MDTQQISTAEVITNNGTIQLLGKYVVVAVPDDWPDGQKVDIIATIQQP